MATSCRPAAASRLAGRFLVGARPACSPATGLDRRASCLSDDPALLAPFLDQLHLIELQFPKYTDGRAFSQAQLLRRRFGYKGEIRATGQVLRDQLRLMIRSGFDAMIIDEADAEGVYDFSAHEFSEFYQAASDTTDTIFMKRQKKREEKAAE
jgi:uncharacterized protein (DUF934 family)